MSQLQAAQTDRPKRFTSAMMKSRSSVSKARTQPPMLTFSGMTLATPSTPQWR